MEKGGLYVLFNRHKWTKEQTPCGKNTAWRLFFSRQLPFGYPASKNGKQKGRPFEDSPFESVV